MGRELILEFPGKPLPGLVTLAGGAMAIPAGAEDGMAFTAFSAGIDDHPVLGRAAGGDRMDDLAMLTRHGMREAADIFGSVG